MTYEDNDNEFSFVKRKKELQSLYNDFKSALSQIQSLPSDDINEIDQKSLYLAEENDESTSIKHKNYEIRSILRELQALKSETLEIKELLQQSARGKQRIRILQIIDKVDTLIQVLSSHSARAEALLTSFQ